MFFSISDFIAAIEQIRDRHGILVIVDDAKLPGGDTLVATTVATVVLSVVAHGLTANPLAAVFGARASSK